MRPLVTVRRHVTDSRDGHDMDIHAAYRILLIQQDPFGAGATRAALAETKGRTFSIEWARDLSAGVDRLNTGPIDAVLLDLFLSDCQGLAAFEQLRQVAPHVPILIVCDLGDESLAMEAVERGAQDYLLRTHCDSFC